MPVEVYKLCMLVYRYYITGVLLTLVLLMKAIDSLKFEHIINERLIELRQIDSKRSSYYGDLRSRYQIENSLAQIDHRKRRVDLSGKVNCQK